MPETAPASCHDLRQGLTEYLDRALPSARRQGFDEHLASCPRCRTLLEQLGLTLDRLAALPREPMPQPMKDTLLRAFRDRPPA